MLAAEHRLTDPARFRAASRHGRRAGSRSVVTHLLLPESQQGADLPGAAAVPEGSARAGFVVARTVGTAVTRNRVKRRLRHAVRERIDTLPPGAVLVVRAQPAAGLASYAELSTDLDHCLTRVLGGRSA